MRNGEFLLEMMNQCPRIRQIGRGIVDVDIVI